MTSKVKMLTENGLLTPPFPFVAETVYEVIMGSKAYGVSNDDSDVDVYAMCVPDKTVIFPHLAGFISGFGHKPPEFDVYQKHHMLTYGAEYDVCVYSIIKYFALCADNNPNMIDSLFVPDRCVIHSTDAGKHMRANRRMFLSKRAYDKLRGYAFAELKKLESYNPEEGGRRKETVEKYGYDVKSAYHIVRLLLEAAMVLVEGDLDLEANREQLKSVRRGDMTLEELRNWFYDKEKNLSTLHANSALQATVDFDVLTVLLKECLEMHFGTLEDAHFENAQALAKLAKIRQLVNT
jgi:predicted nucleotidyltransferase